MKNTTLTLLTIILTLTLSNIATAEEYYFPQCPKTCELTWTSGTITDVTEEFIIIGQDFLFKEDFYKTTKEVRECVLKGFENRALFIEIVGPSEWTFVGDLWPEKFRNTASYAEYGRILRVDKRSTCQTLGGY